MAAKIVLTVNFRDGSTRTISQPTGPDNDKVCYQHLIKSLNYVQEQSNAILTTLVEQEKVQKNGSNVGSKAGSNNGITTCKDASEANSNSGTYILQSYRLCSFLGILYLYYFSTSSKATAVNNGWTAGPLT